MIKENDPELETFDILKILMRKLNRLKKVNGSFLEMTSIIHLLKPGVYAVNLQLHQIYTVKYKIYLRHLKNRIGVYYSKNNKVVGYITKEQIMNNTYMNDFPLLLLNFIKEIKK